METTRQELQITRDLITHTIRHLRDALARTKDTERNHAVRGILKAAIYGNRQARSRLDIVARHFDRSATQDG